MPTSLHKNAVLTTFVHIESRLSEMESLLAQNKRPSPLSEHVNDLSPSEVKTITDCFARIRSTMLACLEKHRIPIDVHRIGLRRTLQTNMYTLSIALAELGPKRLRGYGEVDNADRQDMRSIQQDLDRLGALLRNARAICGG
jgi:uncharacterized protein YejL (UPF0352 family)